MLRSVKVADLLDAEVQSFGIDVQPGKCLVEGYSYVVGEVRQPSAEEHQLLIERSTALGRLLNQDEVALIVGAEGCDDAED